MARIISSSDGCVLKHVSLHSTVVCWNIFCCIQRFSVGTSYAAFNGCLLEHLSLHSTVVCAKFCLCFDMLLAPFCVHSRWQSFSIYEPGKKIGFQGPSFLLKVMPTMSECWFSSSISPRILIDGFLLVNHCISI